MRCIFCKDKGAKKITVNVCEVHGSDGVESEDWLSQDNWEAIQKFSEKKTETFMERIKNDGR